MAAKGCRQPVIQCVECARPLVQRVSKSAKHPGRVFEHCDTRAGGCGHFHWVSERTAVANKRTREEENHPVCPECGKRLWADFGRLRLHCNEHGLFEFGNESDAAHAIGLLKRVRHRLKSLLNETDADLLLFEEDGSDE